MELNTPYSIYFMDICIIYLSITEGEYMAYEINSSTYFSINMPADSDNIASSIFDDANMQSCISSSITGELVIPEIVVPESE
jgi:hypothetical protein